MEYLIDRSNYRRQSSAEKEKHESPQFAYKITKKIIIQTVTCILLFIVAYTIKIFNIQSLNDWLIYEVNRDIPIEDVYNYAKSEIAKIYSKISSDDSIKNEEKTNSQMTINDTTNENILSISTDIPYEITYDEAVEGINQMSEDAKIIKENYKFTYPISGTITSRLGVRNSDNPIVTSYHSGIDIAANEGTKIKSSLSGKVITATTGEAYGKYIMVQTDDIVVVYAHCSKLNVKEGQNVKQGDIIGEVGSTGWATGPHLHFEIRYQGRLVNPDDILDFGE